MKKKEYAAKDMEKLIALGKQKGFLTYDDVNNFLPEDMSSSEEIDRLFEMLGNEDIELIENEEDRAQEKANIQALKEDALNEQMKAEERFLPLDDPVKMYLKQMGSISLLSRELEIELAKKIEEAEEKFKRASLQTRFVRNHTLSVADDILENRINFEEVVKEDIKVKKNNVVGRIRRIVRKYKSTRSSSYGVDLLLALNFTTSVIEIAVRKLNKLVKELEQIDRSTKRNSLRKKQLLRELGESYRLVKEQMKLIKATHIRFSRTKKKLVE
ncbi:MAG: RNA polymerase sigma factor region1.1 domain-containing protein, partial [Candidatus Omnitrophota bacterium]